MRSGPGRCPDAVQIADRFHLIKNLGEVVERVVRGMPRGGTANGHHTTGALRGDCTAASRDQQTHDQVNDIIRRRYEAIHALAATGMLANRLPRVGAASPYGGAEPALAELPERARHPRRPRCWILTSLLAPAVGSGVSQCRRLWREIVVQGFRFYRPVFVLQLPPPAAAPRIG